MKTFRVAIAVVKDTPGSRDFILYRRCAGSRYCSCVAVDRGDREEYCARNKYGDDGKSQDDGCQPSPNWHNELECVKAVLREDS